MWLGLRHILPRRYLRQLWEGFYSSARFVGRTIRMCFRRSYWVNQRHLRLHLGCGKNHVAGYINIDADPKALADIYLDFRHLCKVFKPGSVAEVMMIHSLTYLNLWQARDLFAQLYTLLEPDGKLIIELPDITKCAQKVLESGDSLPDYLEGVRAFYAFEMGWIARRENYTPNAFGWSGWHLKEELERAGFNAVALLDPQTHGPRAWRDIRVEAIK